MKKKRIIIYLGLAFFILLISLPLIYFSNQKITANNAAVFNNFGKTLAVFTNDTQVSSFPAKESGFHFVEVTCDNGSTGIWDETNWQLKMTYQGPDQCQIHFSDQALLFSGDISKTEADNVSFSYYADGSLIITGAGAIRDFDDEGSIIFALFSQYLEYDTAFAESITEDEYAVMGSEEATFLMPVVSGSYEPMINVLNVIYELSVPSVDNYDDYISVLQTNEIVTDPNLFSLAAKIHDTFPGVKDVKIAEGVTALGRLTLSSLGEVSEVILPSTLVTIGIEATNLSTAKYNLSKCHNLTNIGQGAFSWNITDQLIWPEEPQITTISNETFLGFKSPNLVIPNSVMTIDSGAFVISDITNLVLPTNASFTTINSGILANNKNTTNVIIPTNVTTISNDAFASANINLKFKGPERVIRILEIEGGGIFEFSGFNVTWNYSQ